MTDDLVTGALEGATSEEAPRDAGAAARALDAVTTPTPNPPQGAPQAPGLGGEPPKRKRGRPAGAVSSPPSAPLELRRLTKPQLLVELERAQARLAALEAPAMGNVREAEATLTGVALLGGQIGAVTAGPEFAISEEEAKGWARTCAPILAPYLAEAGPYAGALTVTAATFALVLPKYLTWRARRARELAGGNVTGPAVLVKPEPEAPPAPPAGEAATVDVRAPL